MNNKVYVPNITYDCYTFKDHNTIRAYESAPIVGTDINYIDYYIDNHYYEMTGVETIIETPVCLANITDEIYYRNDLPQILFILFFILIFVIYLPLKIFFRIFKKRGV